MAAAEAMLSDPEINAINIATPTCLHSSMTRQAAAAGKHVHCEKPFCASIGEGLDACAAAEQSQTVIAVGETCTFTARVIGKLWRLCR